jgi:hypothetical protein
MMIFCNHGCSLVDLVRLGVIAFFQKKLTGAEMAALTIVIV